MVTVRQPVCLSVCIRLSLCVCVHSHVYVCACVWCVLARACVRVCVYVCVCVSTCLPVCLPRLFVCLVTCLSARLFKNPMKLKLWEYVVYNNTLQNMTARKFLVCFKQSNYFPMCQWPEVVSLKTRSDIRHCRKTVSDPISCCGSRLWLRCRTMSSVCWEQRVLDS